MIVRKPYLLVKAIYILSQDGREFFLGNFEKTISEDEIVRKLTENKLLYKVLSSGALSGEFKFGTKSLTVEINRGIVFESVDEMINWLNTNISLEDLFESASLCG